MVVGEASANLILEKRASGTHWLAGWASSSTSLGVMAKRKIAISADN
jgi:hypothetical protein